MTVERVVIKAFRGVALNRWLIGASGEIAIITDDAGALAAREGLEPEHSLGFPKVDIFRPCDGAVDDGSMPNWADMRHRF